MARLDIYANPTPNERVHTPFVVDVQNDHLGAMASRVVIPLRSILAMPMAAQTLNPQLDVAGQTVVLDTASLAPVPASLLRKPVARADAAAAEILDALDALLGN